MSERVDELEKYYVPIERVDKILSLLFILGAFLSLGILFISNLDINNYDSIIKPFFILVVILYTILSIVNSYYLIPNAEKFRRKQLLSNSFDISLIHEQTQNYYNNEFEPTIKKLGMNVLENSFFAKNICKEMLIRERVKNGIYFSIWLIILLNREVDLNYVLIITQTIFSGEIIIKWIKLEILKYQNEKIYEQLHFHFSQGISNTSNNGIANILDLVMSYEVAKGNASIKQSSKIFHKLNEKLSQEWEEIKIRLLSSNN